MEDIQACLKEVSSLVKTLSERASPEETTYPASGSGDPRRQPSTVTDFNATSPEVDGTSSESSPERTNIPKNP